MKTGRNTPCHCGSGLKHKFCCGPKNAAAKKTRILVIAALVIFGGLALAGTVLVSNDKEPTPAPSAPPPATAGGPGTPQPGAAPPGKVWSAEHGHWHDAPGQTPAAGSTGQPQPAATQPGAAQPGTPQPPGPAPAGKVWSVEHGHWHDAP